MALETKPLCINLQYSFVTPLTSMVVTKPEIEEEIEQEEEKTEVQKSAGTQSRKLYSKRPDRPACNLDGS